MGSCVSANTPADDKSAQRPQSIILPMGVTIDTESTLVELLSIESPLSARNPLHRFLAARMTSKDSSATSLSATLKSSVHSDDVLSTSLDVEFDGRNSTRNVGAF